MMNAVFEYLSSRSRAKVGKKNISSLRYVCTIKVPNASMGAQHCGSIKGSSASPSFTVVINQAYAFW